MIYECFVQDTPQHHDHLVEELWESQQEGCPGIDYTLLRNNLRDISSTTVTKTFVTTLGHNGWYGDLFSGHTFACSILD